MAKLTVRSKNYENKNSLAVDYVERLKSLRVVRGEWSQVTSFNLERSWSCSDVRGRHRAIEIYGNNYFSDSSSADYFSDEGLSHDLAQSSIHCRLSHPRSYSPSGSRDTERKAYEREQKREREKEASKQAATVIATFTTTDGAPVDSRKKILNDADYGYRCPYIYRCSCRYSHNRRQCRLGLMYDTVGTLLRSLLQLLTPYTLIYKPECLYDIQSILPIATAWLSTT
jgi:hypothetical protein